MVIGITGGIATGKSTVTAMFAELGAQTLSADEVAREVLSPGSEALQEVVDQFGPGVVGPNGVLDRPALAARVFGNADALAKLNNITHPRIISTLEYHIQRFRELARDNDVFMAEIPLLIECGLQHIVDKVIVVMAEQEAQLYRLTTRGLSLEEAHARISAQIPLKEKIAAADWVIRTDMSLDDTRRQVETIWQEILI